MSVELTGQWELALRLTRDAPARFPAAADIALKRRAVDIEGKIRKNIKAGPPPPQARTTALTGGRGKPLNRTGDLGNSVAVVPAGRLEYFIGIPRNAGKYNLAVVHENGAVVVQEMTARMRRFLHARLASEPKTSAAGGSGFVVSRIPARPFVEPAAEEVRGTYPQDFARDFSQALNGDYGRV